MPPPITHYVTAALLLLSPLTAAAWSTTDAKPVAELELMDDGELAHEALTACLNVALNLPGSIQASNYLLTVYHVLRKKHGGAAPSWMGEMLHASTSGDSDQCGKAFDSYLTTQKQKYKSKVKKLTP